MIIGEFIETYPPELDGVGHVASSYCRTLESMGHTVYYVAPGSPKDKPSEGLRTLLYRGLRLPGQNYRLGVPSFSFSFRRKIAEIPFDIIHIHTPFLSGKLAFRIAKKRNIPVVATFHSKYYDDFYRATRNRLIAKLAVRLVVRAYNRCDAVWTVNHETAKVLRSYGYEGEIGIIPNGTDILPIHPEMKAKVRERYGIPDGCVLLLFVGQVDMKKNIQTTVRACGILKKQGLDFRFLIIGEGPDHLMLKLLSREFDVADRVIFGGFVSDTDELRAIFSEADLFVFPSLYDSAPMVVREAAAAATPAVLIRDSCSAEGLTDNDNVFLCENTPEDLAKRIAGALPAAADVGRRALETIPIPWNKLMRDVEDRYRAAIGSNKAERRS